MEQILVKLKKLGARAVTAVAAADEDEKEEESIID